MNTEKVFWAGVSVISMSFVMMFTYFFMMVVFPFHVAEVKKRAGETVYHLQTVLPHLQPEIRQTYLQGLSQKAEDLSYLLLMDMHGTALAHSNPDRVGMNFDDPGFRQCLATGQRAEQLYVRDADKPSSPYHNEKTIDILDIYHTADGLTGGVVNVGISLAAIEKIKGKYITVSAIAVIFWLVFISVFAVVHFRTMHQKRKTDKALSDSERRLSQAIAASSDAIWEWNLLSGRTYYSPRWYTMLGYADEEFEMTIDQWKALCHPADLQPTLDLVQAAIVAHGNLGYEAEFRMRHKQGDWRWILGRGNVVGFDNDDKPLLMGGTNTDITERKGHEEKLRESEARYRRIIENIADVYYRTDKDGNLIIVSPSGVRLLGYDSAGEMLGRPNAFFWANPQERLEMMAMLQSKGSVSDYEVVLQRRDGSLVQVSTSSAYYRDQHGQIQGVEGIFRDITERKRAEKEWKDLQGQLLHAQKMEAVGRLAGGVAHDFNNMLVVIMGRAELALMKTSPSHPLHGDLLEISSAAERSAGLTRHLLAFARKQTVSPQVLDLNITIEKMLTMHRRLIGEDIELEWLPGQGLTPVKIDPSQVDQLLVNLCVNARDAISGVGKVTIKTENVFLDTAFCAKHAGLIPGGYVALAVSDSGCGMDQDVLDHIFEPFFTTKGEKGTGIGLATVFGIVKQNEGGVTVKSAPGTGTTFTIYLRGYAEHIQTTELLSSFETMKGNGETILLVEDESTIIELGKVMLEALNYQVLPAGTPEEALDLAENHAGKIHLLITDVIMPQMNGRDLAARILAMRQDI